MCISQSGLQLLLANSSSNRLHIAGKVKVLRESSVFEKNLSCVTILQQRVEAGMKVKLLNEIRTEQQAARKGNRVIKIIDYPAIENRPAQAGMPSKERGNSSFP